jgi:hypothetical protein
MVAPLAFLFRAHAAHDIDTIMARSVNEAFISESLPADLCIDLKLPKQRGS